MWISFPSGTETGFVLSQMVAAISPASEIGGSLVHLASGQTMLVKMSPAEFLTLMQKQVKARDDLAELRP